MGHPVCNEPQGSSFVDTFTVTDCECDAENRMTPGAILRRTQQIATDHSTSLGMDTPLYHRLHCAFLLAKMAMEQQTPIRTGQFIRIQTWASAPQRAVYHRCTTLYDDRDTALCRIDSRWILADTETHHILRRPPEGFPTPYTLPPAYELPLDFPRGETATVAEETARYTRCDTNHHLNNTYYADIVLDHTPLDRLSILSPARLVVLYHSEIPLGASFTLGRAETGENAWYFCGRNPADGKKHFEASLTLTRQDAE